LLFRVDQIRSKKRTIITRKLDKMAKILILGGGLAAVAAAEALAPAAHEHEVVLVSKNSDLTFYPGIVRMIFDELQPADLRFDLRPELAERNIRFVQGEVRSINTFRRTVDVARDRTDDVLEFDYLIIAIGPRAGSDTIPGLSEFAHTPVTLDAALRFKEALDSFRSGAIVIGLCPLAVLPVPVCELALALAAKYQDEVRAGDVSVNVVFPETIEKAFAGSSLFRDIEGEFKENGVELTTDFAVSHVDNVNVFSSASRWIPYDLLALIPPFTTQLSLRNLGPVTDISGFIKVNPLMQVVGHGNVYAAGDVVSIPGPRFGYMAVRQGKTAASNILAELRGEERATEYVHTVAWALSQRYTRPTFFHYGIWDDTLEDHDEGVLFGFAKKLRDHFRRIADSEGVERALPPKTSGQ
jgi:NADH dehydrogenase FAD-containing subunit